MYCFTVLTEFQVWLSFYGFMMTIKSLFFYILAGLILPTLLLLNAFVIPEPYSHPLIEVALLPRYLMPFLEDRELMKTLTLLVFGRQTANYAPIALIFFSIFWFLVSLALYLLLKNRSDFFNYIKRYSNSIER